jgi:hypothetical protein
VINFKYDKGNSPSEERNDCTVRALKIATGCKYYDAYRFLYNAGRKPNKGFYIEKVLKKSCFYFGCQFTKLSFRKPITLSKFIKNYDKGVFYLRKRGHVFVVKDGIVHDDIKPRPYSMILMAWKVEPLLQ